MIDYSIVCKSLLEEDDFLIYVLDACPGDLPGLLEFRKMRLSDGVVAMFVANHRNLAVQDVQLWLNRVCKTQEDLRHILGNYATKLKQRVASAEQILSKITLEMNHDSVVTTFPYVLVGIPKEGDFVEADGKKYTQCFVGCFLRYGVIVKSAKHALESLGFEMSHWIKDVELTESDAEGYRWFASSDTAGKRRILLTVPVGQ